MKNLYLHHLFGLMLLLLLFSNLNTYSQSFYPQLRYENGDTIPYTFPPPDSTYIHNEILILFRPQSLYLEKLC
jgi:hypothetical protein